MVLVKFQFTLTSPIDDVKVQLVHRKVARSTLSIQVWIHETTLILERENMAVRNLMTESI